MQFNLINFLDRDSLVSRERRQLASEAVIGAGDDRREVVAKRICIESAAIRRTPPTAFAFIER